ncbi:MAG TPA: hypothetical protein VFP34_16380 [Microlunatus sp.]|nr:hypothetical protein [Microlunatus sp.]
MSTQLSTQPAADHTVSRPGRAWAYVGVLAGVTGIASIQLSMSASPTYDPGAPPTAESILGEMGQFIPQLIGFHVTTVLTALLMIVFTAGLKRRLDRQAPAGSILPTVAMLGLAGTASVLVLGSGLNTEFVFGLSQPELMVASDVSFYSHWVATIPWLWVLAGLSGFALGLAALRGAAPRWIGVVGLVLGGLTMLTGLSPLQYLAGFVGPVWLLVTAIGFAVGDRTKTA